MKKDKKQIKIEHFSNLVAVAYADGVFKEEELDFLADKAEDFGLSKSEIKDVIDRAPELHFQIPMNDEEREDQLTDVVFMSMVDGHVDEREYDLCLKIAEKLDFDEKYLDHIISLVLKLWK